ncbi:hypothetical protein D3C78_1478700 [compost metagenome]
MISFNRLYNFAQIIACNDILIMSLRRIRIVRQFAGQLHFEIREPFEMKGLTKAGNRRWTNPAHIG